MTCKNKHRSTTVLEEILPDLHDHIAKLAWLIQECIFLVKKGSFGGKCESAPPSGEKHRETPVI